MLTQQKLLRIFKILRPNGIIILALKLHLTILMKLKLTKQQDFIEKKQFGLMLNFIFMGK